MTGKFVDVVDPAVIERTRWKIDESRSQFAFRVSNNWGLATVEGSFDRFGGILDLRRRPALEISIEAASVRTRNRWRDGHLRSAAFFDTDHHPFIRFVSESARLEHDRLHVLGWLGAAGRSVPLRIESSIRLDGEELDVEAAAEIDQRELGISWSPFGVIRPPTALSIRARLVRDDRAADCLDDD